jgi:sulfate adenylyltransferase subunit 1
MKQSRGLTRFITAGSVDDGKSTLIGRLLYDAKLVLNDQLNNLKKLQIHADENHDFDFSYLTDGLESEREQGITIDVAYRYFSTKKNKFIIADCPGHKQYTRNMITGASTADCIILLLDITKIKNGELLEQTKRHALIASLLNIPNVIIAINKMDLVNYDKDLFFKATESFKKLLASLNWEIKFWAVPVSALKGDNIVNQSLNMKWYEGKPLLQLLETCDKTESSNNETTVIPIQFVSRWNTKTSSAQRAYCGKVESGSLKTQEKLKVFGSNQTVTIRKILYRSSEVFHAKKLWSIMILLENDVGLSRGDILVGNKTNFETKEVLVDIAWLDDQPFAANKKYILKQGTLETTAKIFLKSKFDLDLITTKTSDFVSMNEIGTAIVKTVKPIINIPYTYKNKLGAMVLIDPTTHQTAAALLIRN